MAILISEYLGHGDLKTYLAKMGPSFHERLRLVCVSKYMLGQYTELSFTHRFGT